MSVTATKGDKAHIRKIVERLLYPSVVCQKLSGPIVVPAAFAVNV